MKRKKWLSGIGSVFLLIGGSYLLGTESPETHAAPIELDKETEKAYEVHLASVGFIETYGNVEKASVNEDEYFEKREELSQFITDNLLEKLYLSREEIEEMYGIEEFFTADPGDQEFKYSKEVLEHQVFINYDTLDDRTVFAIAYITVEETMGDITSVNEERVSIRLEREDGQWLVDGLISSHL